MGKYAGGVVPPQGLISDIDEKIYKMTNYAKMCGDKVEIIELSEDEPCDDLKIILLKASSTGQYIKDTGIKIRHDKFAVYREEGEPLWSK